MIFASAISVVEPWFCEREVQVNYLITCCSLLYIATFSKRALNQMREVVAEIMDSCVMSLSLSCNTLATALLSHYDISLLTWTLKSKANIVNSAS